MADNVPITPGTGATIASDEVGGAQYQLVKIALGAPNAVDTHLDSGQQAAANSVPVAIASDQTAIPIQGNASDNAAMGSQKPVPFGRKFTASSPTYDEGDVGFGRMSVNGFDLMTLAELLWGEDATNGLLGMLPKVVVAATYSPSLYAPLTQVAKANIKASAAQIVSFSVTNDNAAVRYLQLFNKATAPAGGDVPIYSWKIPAGTANNPGTLDKGTEFFTQAGKYFATGLGFAISTTLGTFTDSATASEHIIQAHYY